MKIFLVFLYVVFGVLSHHLPEEENEKLKELHEACQANPITHAEETLLKHIRDYAEDKHVRAHIFCMSVKGGFQRENGDLVKDVIRNKVALVTHDQTKVDGLVKKCVVKKDTPERTAVQLWLCFLDNSIHYVYEF